MPFWKKKEQRDRKTPIRLCPQCEQPTLQKTAMGVWTNTEFYQCSGCGYKGAFYIEVDPEEMGENFADLSQLKRQFPEDVDEETDTDLHSPSVLKNLTKKSDTTHSETELEKTND